MNEKGHEGGRHASHFIPSGQGDVMQRNANPCHSLQNHCCHHHKSARIQGHQSQICPFNAAHALILVRRLNPFSVACKSLANFSSAPNSLSAVLALLTGRAADTETGTSAGAPRPFSKAIPSRWTVEDVWLDDRRLLGLVKTVCALAALEARRLLPGGLGYAFVGDRLSSGVYRSICFGCRDDCLDPGVELAIAE